MIQLTVIDNNELEDIFKEYRSSLDFLKTSPFYIEALKTYDTYLSRLLKTIVKADDPFYAELKKRIAFNRELENKLATQGFEIHDLGNSNPKNILLKIVNLLCSENNKTKAFFDKIMDNNSKNITSVIISNNYDEDFITNQLKIIGIVNYEIIRYSRIDTYIKTIKREDVLFIDYSLDGYHDFLKYYSIDFDISLVLYEPEKLMYDLYVKKYQRELEVELASPFREKLSGIKYETTKQSQDTRSIALTIQSIIGRTNDIDDIEETEFESLKENPEFIDDLVYEYIIDYEEDLEPDKLDSNELVFDQFNKLVKIGKIRKGDRIRVYDERLNHNLYDIAAQEDEETFQLIEKYSYLWKNPLINYYKSNYITFQELFEYLKGLGLTIKDSTLRNYIEGKTMFPMRRADLNAILKLTKDQKLAEGMTRLLKYKRIYHSIMISLGKNLRGEICNYLQTKKIGNILRKDFTSETLNNFINMYMPLKTVKKIEINIKDEQS